MIELVVSGGQTGADLAGWRAAQAAGIPTGGWMPRGFLTEDGPRPAFAELYGARETLTADYPTRTRLNVERADVTLWFGGVGTAGFVATERACVEKGRPMLRVAAPWLPRPSGLLAELRVLSSHRVVNVAGNRASGAPGIEEWVEEYLLTLFELMKT